MTDTPIETYERCLALDIHRHNLVVGGESSFQEIILSPRRVDYEHILNCTYNFGFGGCIYFRFDLQGHYGNQFSFTGLMASVYPLTLCSTHSLLCN